MKKGKNLVECLIAALMFSLVAAFATRGVASGANPDEHPYSVDKANSEIRFVVKSRLKPIEGKFENWLADVRLEPSKGESLGLVATAQAGSVKTGNFLEEGMIRGENFFAAEKYPEIRLASKKIESSGANSYRMDADLTLRGVTHPVPVPFSLTFDGAGGGKIVGEFEFSRKEFGITYNMALNPIEDLVKVIVTLTIHPSSTGPASPAAGNN